MGALTHNGEVLQSLPANASQINFDKTGTNLNSTQTENAIKEVNTKVNTNTTDINQLKSGLTTKVTFTSVGGTNSNYRDVTIPSDNNAVFLIVAGGSITSVTTDSSGNVSDITFVSSQDSTKIDDHTVRIFSGSWYRSYSVLKFA